MTRSGARRALVTGGAGFVGSHIVERLISHGIHTSIIDDLSTGSPDNVPADCAMYQVSITDPLATRVIADERPDYIVHCAAQISVPKSMADPVGDLCLNVAGTANILAAARAAGVQRFVFLSSGGAVYGERDSPATEDSAPRPTSYYGVHKLTAEYHAALSGVPCVILRPSNVYGPRQRSDLEGGVISIFTRNAAEGRPITIFGDGTHTRDFIHVRNVVDAVMELLSSDQVGTWNVSSGDPVSIGELARLVGEVSGVSVPVTHEPPRPGDVHSSILSSEKLQRDTNWRPSVSLVAGLSESIADIHAGSVS